MTVLLYLITYGALGLFALVVAYRAWRIYKMPLHLRWELYPVAHEASKAHYGGSILEELNWWDKPREKSLFGELKVMIPEMTLLVALFEHNRKLWLRSFPFHFGLYALAGFVGLLVLGALMQLVGFDVSPRGSIGALVHYVTIFAGLFGLTLASVGAVALLHRRLTDPDLKDYTSVAAKLNLLAFIGVFWVAWMTFLFGDRDFSLTRNFVGGMITFPFTFTAQPVGSWLVGLEVILAVGLIAYIPMTHMSHFFLKWFTYHKIRWDDEPNEKGSWIEQKIIEQVQYPVTWAAPFLKADGKKNWVDIATEEMEK